MFYRTFRSIRYRYRCCLDTGTNSSTDVHTGTGGTGTDAVPNVRYRYWCRTELTIVSGTGNTGGIYQRYATVRTVPNTPLVNDVPPEPNLRSDCSLSFKKAYIHGNLFWTPARSIRCILQPEKCLRNERYKCNSMYWSACKTYEFSRHWCCLARNFGHDVNLSYSHRFKPLTEPRVS